MADVHIDDFSHVAQGGHLELESGEGLDVDFMRRVDVFRTLTGRSRKSVHKAVRSEVASATLWSAEIRGIDGRLPCPFSDAPAASVWASVWDRCLGLLGDVVLVSSGASL